MGLYSYSLCVATQAAERLADVVRQCWNGPTQHKCCANQECLNDMYSITAGDSWHTRALSRSIAMVRNYPAYTHWRVQWHSATVNLLYCSFTLIHTQWDFANHTIFPGTPGILASVSCIPAMVYPECKISRIFLNPDISASMLIHTEVQCKN